MIRQPPRSTLDRSAAASDVYKRQREIEELKEEYRQRFPGRDIEEISDEDLLREVLNLSLIHISEPTRPY